MRFPWIPRSLGQRSGENRISARKNLTGILKRFKRELLTPKASRGMRERSARAEVHDLPGEKSFSVPGFPAGIFKEVVL